MLRKGTEYLNICSILGKWSPKSTEYRNIKEVNISVLCTFETNSYIFYKYYGALHLSV
jgi:hypothetical protein